MWRDMVKAIRDQREANRLAAMRDAVAAYLERLPIERQTSVVASALSRSDIDETILRKFVSACPADKRVEVTFPSGAQVVITASSHGARGPGW